MTKSLKYVGQTAPIHDAMQKVCGTLVYGSDYKMPNMCYAKFLLSPVAHGNIKHIDTSQAEALPGVIKVFTHLNSVSTAFSRYRTLPRQENAPEDEVLFTSKARFAGDRIAAVVAKDLKTAKFATKLIRVEYEEIEPCVNPDDSLNQSIPEIHEGGNFLHHFDYQHGQKEDSNVDDICVESTTKIPKVHHAAIEPHGCLADYDGDRLTVYATCQGVFGIRTIVADLLKMDYCKVRVIKMPMGGSFGGRQEATVEPVTAFMARELKRPVKLVMDREECIIATSSRPASKTNVKTVVSRDGYLKEFSAYTLLDAGAYATSSVDNAYSMKSKTPRLYRIPFYSYSADIVYTNTIIGGGMRGWGAPEIMTALETHMDNVAIALNMDPVSLRLRNLIDPYDIDPASKLSLGNARVKQCLTEGAEAFDWQTKRALQQTPGRFRLGYGMAVGAHKNGAFGAFPEHSSMILKMNEDGSFQLNTGLHDLGCGTLTSIQLIVAEQLGCDSKRITVLEADTERGPYDLGSYGSRVTYVCGQCAFLIAGLMKDQIKTVAAKILKTSPDDIMVKPSGIQKKGTEKECLTWRNFATTAKVDHDSDFLVSHTYHAISNPGVYSAHFAGVEVDCATGMINVADYLVVQDIGKAINRGMVEGQIQGAVQMGIGHALCEEIKVAEKGENQTESFKNYHVINAVSMPEVKTILVEEGKDDGPYGAKSVGEIALVPVIAAVVNAVNHALGTQLSDLPLTPEKILAAISSS